MDAALDVRGVTVRFGDRVVLDGLDLAVGAGERAALLGPSGSGKSTLLRVIAGLLRPDAGTVHVAGVDVSHLPAHRRQVGLVFQDEQLFPHRTVAQNVAFGLRMRRVPRSAIDRRVADLLELVGLAGFDERAVPTLSGGEAKRVALARALAPEPRVLLLDEPLTGLDRELHDRLAVDLRDLLAGLGTTALHVTHDEAEALVVAQRVVRLGGDVRGVPRP